MQGDGVLAWYAIDNETTTPSMPVALLQPCSLELRMMKWE